MNIRSLTILIAVSIIGLVVIAPTATTQQPLVARKTVFSTLKVGQAVTLRDKGNLYEIGTMDLDLPMTHRVVEIADDFIVLRDESELIETRIPVTAVRAVIHMKTRPK